MITFTGNKPLETAQMAQTLIQPEVSYLATDSESDSEDAQCILNRIERRLSKLEGVLWAMCQRQQAILKRSITFDYIESWLSTTVSQDACTLGDTVRESRS